MGGRIAELHGHLADAQREDGLFSCRYVHGEESFIHDRCIFSASIILAALHADADAADIKQKLSASIANELTEHWFIRFWKCHDGEEHGIPDRLDMTCTALAALTLFQRDLFNPDVLTRSVLLLTSAEVQEGGPYRAWAGTDDMIGNAKNALDPVINADIAYFLGLHDIRLENLDAYLDEAIETGSFHSAFYPTEYAVIYALARAYRGPLRDRLRARLVNRFRADGGWGNPLDTALAVSSLLRLGERGEPVRKGIERLCHLELQEIIQPYPRFLHPLKSEGWCGHEDITVAHCLEALTLFEQSMKEHEHPAMEEKDDIVEHPAKDQILSIVRERSVRLPLPLSARAETFLESLVSRDRDGQIVSFPAMFHEALRRKTVPAETVTSLCVANVFGWMAYTIFDDFLDGEGSAEDLSVGTFSLRELTAIYNSFGPDIRNLFRYTMDLVDAANAWEIAYARTVVADQEIIIPERLPLYDDARRLTERSLGHALGPLTILFLSGFAARSAEVRAVKSYIIHMLAAKQLCDDVEDWEEDLRAGRINFVAADLLNRWKGQNDGLHGSFPLEEIILELQHLLWREALPGISKTIAHHAARARAAIVSADTILQSDKLDGFLGAYEHTAEYLLKQRDERLALLAELSAS